MTSLTRIPDSFWRSIGMQLVGVNDRSQLFPNIWVFRSLNLSAPTLISSSSQHLFVQFLVGGIAHGLVFVYAATTSVARRPLWSEIELINSSFTGPLLLVGDFNAILGAHEKSGGRLPTRVSCHEFQHMVDVCHLTQIDLKGSPFTWTNGRGVGSHIEMLLDRCFCSIPWLDSWPVTSCSTLVRHSSDHNPLLISFKKYVAQGPIPFRFQKIWSGHSDFLKTVQAAWQSFEVSGCPMFILQRKLMLLKHILKDWNVNIFGNVHTAVDKTRTALENIQLAISRDGFTDARHSEELTAHDALSNALLVQENFWADKAKVRWVKEGDRNTGYFHTLAKIRRSRSFITSLRVGDDLVEDVNSLRDHVVRHFTTAFSDDGNIGDTGLVENIIPSLVSYSENCCLLAIPSVEEIKNAVFSMNADSAPGPDGYSGHFFQGMWLAIKFDIAKAFDTLNWDFLRRVLIAFGFHATFVDWISSILASARLSILFNGSPVGFFGCSRGVRQGDPLSPLLFCLAEEVLSRGILRLVDLGHVQTISSPRAVKVPSHVLFADDIMVFCKGSVSSRAYHPVAWKKCCAPLNEGGLGVRNIMVLNKAFLLKKFWDCLTKSSLAAEFFSARFLGRSGNGKSVDFWHANWLHGSVVENLGIEQQLAKLLNAKVSDFIKDGTWYCPSNLNTNLATLWSEILSIRLPYLDVEDKLVWLDSSDGLLSLSMAYEVKRSKQTIVPWDSEAFTLLPGALFVMHLLRQPTTFSLSALSLGRSRVKYFLGLRNSIRFDEHCLTPDYLIHSIKLQIREVDSWGLGTMRNSVDELCILRALGMNGRTSKPHQIREVNWHAPNAFEFKVNTDGAARGSPGPAGYGGIFRDHWGNCMGCFAGSMGIATALEAELQAIIHAVSMASRKGWRSLWIECDSAIAIHFLANNKGSVPWRLRADWINCCSILSSMQVRFSHILREGNQVADCLANFGVDHEGQYWWDSCPSCASAAFVHNLQDLPNFRIA
ncbi:hypothetical protein ACLB2K_003521 [Fragaria x ananassa]